MDEMACKDSLNNSPIKTGSANNLVSESFVINTRSNNYFFPSKKFNNEPGRRRTATTSQVDLRYNKLVALSNQEYLTQVLETIAIPR